jgi:hypothetical protein
MRMILSSAAMALVVSATGSVFAAGGDAVQLAQAAPVQTESAPAAVSAPATPAVAPAPQKLVGLAAWSQIVGNTITGKEDGKVLVEFYGPDGVAKSMNGNEISTGNWALAGETVCFKYTDDDKPECYRLEVVGSTVTYYDQKGSGNRYEILKGNPKGL